jgi:hypothetical protein
MSSAGKRLDLRFGAFACSVQGFDDPVQPVQQILRAIQHLLEESPELADTAINFDAEAIEQLVGEVARRADLDESEVEIVPGLIIIHHGAGGDLARLDSGDDWAAEPVAPAASAPEGGYVNIFAPGGADDAESAGADAPADDFAERLRRMAQDGGAYQWDEDEITAAAPAAAADPAPAEMPLNLFAGAPAEDAAARGVAVRNLFASAPPHADEPQPAAAIPWNGAGQDTEAEKGAEAGYTAAGLAERAGARSVAELMVASAAWMVLIQGQTRFARRDVLDVFETIPGDHDRSLEARIKGFGKAVRNGHLVMIEDGVFGLSRAELERFQALL